MSTLQIRKAQRTAAFLKLALTGTAGSGKTYSALRLATGLANGGKILLADTENRSADLYADNFDFDKIDILPPFASQNFVDSVEMAVNEGYSVLIIDSASHLWQGILEYKSDLDARGGNQFTNWKKPGDSFNQAMQAFLQKPIHIIACLRSKTEYAQEENGGRKTVKKLGMAPVFRDGSDFEFTTVFDIDPSHKAMTSKDRTGLFSDKIFQITEETGATLLHWMNSAKPAPVADRKPAAIQDPVPAAVDLKADSGPPDMVEEAQADEIYLLLDDPRIDPSVRQRCPDPSAMTKLKAAQVIAFLKKNIKIAA